MTKIDRYGDIGDVHITLLISTTITTNLLHVYWIKGLMSYFPLGRSGKYINIFEVHLYFFMIYIKISWDIFLFLYILFLMLFVLCARCVI